MPTHQLTEYQRRNQLGIRLRGLAAAAVLVSATVHLMLWDQGFASINVIGPLFMLNAVGGLLIGVAMLLWRHWLPVLGAVEFGALSLAALLWSAAFGLFGVSEPLNGLPQLVSIVAETGAVVFGMGAIRVERTLARVPDDQHEPWLSDVRP